MDLLDAIEARIGPEHARALEWFANHEGEVGPRPWRKGGQSVVAGIDVPLVAQRGIHRPGGWDLALSVTATRSSVYLDGNPIRMEDDTWGLPYKAHSGADGAGMDSRWNSALFANTASRIPVGVFVPSGRSYRNLGLAMVESYDPSSDTFLLRGPVQHDQPSEMWQDPLGDSDRLGGELVVAEEPAEWVETLRRRRHRQDEFRDQLLTAYGSSCCVTGYDAVPALQGAHILAYSGRASQSAQNGLLLRSDIHLLFDASRARMPSVRVETDALEAERESIADRPTGLSAINAKAAPESRLDRIINPASAWPAVAD